MSKKIRWDKNRDELLGYFAEGLLTVQEEKAVARLIKDDPALQEEVRIQKEIARLMAAEEPPSVPDHVIHKAKGLVNEPFGARVWSLVARFAGDAGWWLKSDGVFANPPVAFAGQLRGPSSKRPRPILIKKDFGAVSIQVEIERSQNSANRIVFYAEDLKTKDPFSDLRITLLENDTELESHITCKGKALFENVPSGRFVFDVSGPNRPIARIILEIFQE